MNFVHLRGYFGCYCCGKLQTFWGEKWTTESMEMEKGLTAAFQWKTRIIVITEVKTSSSDIHNSGFLMDFDPGF